MTVDKKYLEILMGLVEKTNHKVPFWLEDLMLLGPRFEEWKLDGLPPNRVLLTEMLGRWSKYAGLSEAESIEWLMPFNCEVLALTSKTDPSGIRHGTRCNTRWVYNSNYLFDFEAFVRDLPETAFQNTPPYMPVFAKWWDLLLEAKQKARDSYVPPVFELRLPVKQRYREQFLKSIAVAREKLAEGASMEETAEFLNAQKLPTATGRKWNYGTLRRSLKQLDQEKQAGDPPPASP
jgi:Recombinase